MVRSRVMRRGWPRFPRRRGPIGLESVPERLRPQFLALASQRPGGLDEQDALVVAAAWAQQAAPWIPWQVRRGHPDGLDRWFRGHRQAILEQEDVCERAVRGGGWYHAVHDSRTCAVCKRERVIATLAWAAEWAPWRRRQRR